MAKNPMYGQNKADAVAGSAFVTVGIAALASAGNRYCVCPIDGKLFGATFMVTTATTSATTAITFKDGAGDTIGTGSIPVTAINGGVIVARDLDSDSDATLKVGDVVEVEFDGAAAAGAGDLVVQFIQ